MAESEPKPMKTARDELLDLLADRATVLAPSEELINRALRRCVRHDLRAKGRASARLQVKTASESTPAGSGEFPLSRATPPGAALEPVKSDDDLLNLIEPIDTAVAQAHTLAEGGAETHPPAPAPVIAGAGDAALMAVSDGPAVAGKDSGIDSGNKPRILTPGTTLGGYRIESLIGVGGMGQVYRATQISMSRQVAIKVLLARYTKNPRFRERFLREARAAGRLHHPNLIAVHDVGEADGLLFFSMELVEGTSIKQLITELGRISEDRALEIARQALEALRYAHERGIIHRDIKPDNLMLTSTGTVKVADLGLSRSDNDEGGDQFTTQTGTMMGTPYYMPPEQGRDAHRADLRADLYALGATLYHMVCGKVPFEGDSVVAILIAASTQPLSFADPPPSGPLRRFLEKLMAKKAQERPQSASDALAMIRTLHHGPFAVGDDAPAQPPTRLSGPAFSGRGVGRARRRRRIRRAGISFAVILACVVVAGGAWWELQNGPRRELKRSVAELSEGHRYGAALAQVDLAQERRPRDAGLCAELREQITSAWNAWAAKQAKDVLADVDTALGAGKLTDADAALDRVQEAWRSPAVLAEIESRARLLEEARNRQPAEVRHAEMRKLINLWMRQLFAGKGEFSDGTVTVSDRGSVLLTTTLRNKPVPPLELTIRMPAGSDRLAVVFAPGVELRFGSAGATLVRADKSETLVASSNRDGRTSVVLRSSPGAYEVSIPDGKPADGRRVPSNGAATLEWDLSGNHQATIGISVPVGMMRRMNER